MKRKDFIKTTAGLAASTALVPFMGCKGNSKEVMKLAKPLKNWAGNFTYSSKYRHVPATVEEVQALVKKYKTQKALGSRHCFNNIADNPLHQISTERLSGAMELNKENLTLTIGSGTKYGDFAPKLHQEGYAIHNLASLPHISVAGACATATHGSGVKNGNLATSVQAIEFVSGNGEIIQLDHKKNPQQFNGAVVHLGALGILTKVTLKLQKTYDVRQDVFQDLPLEELVDNFDRIMSAGYSVSLFTDWQDKKISQVWVKRRIDQPMSDLTNDFYGAQAATRNLHPITRLSAENCTQQMGVPGPWYDRLPHFKMGFTPSSGKELQSEFFIPYQNAREAILALEKKRDKLYPQLMITEIRTVAADSFWMSPCYQENCVAIHFTWKQNPLEVSKLIGMIEDELAPYNARPHWGKLFSTGWETLMKHYEKLPDFIQLAQKYDPDKKFVNSYLQKNVFGKIN